MTVKVGTHSVESLLAVRNVSAIKFGVDTIAAVLNADNANWSAQLTAMLADFAETSTDRQRVVGTSVTGEMQEVDEFGNAPTQKDIPSYFLGFPLRKFQFNLGWNRQYLKYATPNDFAVKNGAAQGAAVRRTRGDIQRAIFTPTNAAYIDHLVDKGSLPVKAFYNADSAGIPNGPNGETFDSSTHTHYTGIASLTNAAGISLQQNVQEHRNGTSVRIVINTADVATWQALSGFSSLLLPQFTVNANANQIADPRLDISKQDNRLVGYFNGSEVWTKPWAFANYAVAMDMAAVSKPLVRRVEGFDEGLRIAAEIESHPLIAQIAELFQGFAPYNRAAVAVLRFNNATYAAPTITY